MDQPGTSTTGDSGMCKLCNAKQQKYTCPKCEIPYCSLECYKSEGHLECSENFYKAWVESELRDQKQNPEDRKKMIDILKRMHATDLEFGDDTLEDIQENNENENFDDSVDSDDDEIVPDLENRLQSIDLNNADEVWSLLTDAERQEFEASLRNGEAVKLLPIWSPWWFNMSVGKELIQELGDNEEKRDYTAECPEVVDVPTFNELSKASPSVRYNLSNVLHAYVYMALHFNGEHHNSPIESADIFLLLCENMRKNIVFEDSKSAVESVSQRAKICQSLFGGEEAMVAAKEAVNSIVTGPEESNQSYYVLAALSDLHTLFTNARKELFSRPLSSNQEKSTNRSFSRRFHISESTAKVSKRTLLLCEKKIEYYLSWVKSYGIRVS